MVCSPAQVAPLRTWSLDHLPIATAAPQRRGIGRYWPTSAPERPRPTMQRWEPRPSWAWTTCSTVAAASRNTLC